MYVAYAEQRMENVKAYGENSRTIYITLLSVFPQQLQRNNHSRSIMETRCSLNLSKTLSFPVKEK